MNKQQSILLGLGLSVTLLTGCTWVRGVNSADLNRYPNSKPTSAAVMDTPAPGALAPKITAQPQALHPMDKQALVEENNTLRKQQAKNNNRLTMLEAQLLREQKAHQVFRKRMVGNLKILEASLADKLASQKKYRATITQRKAGQSQPYHTARVPKVRQSKQQTVPPQAKQLNGHSQMAIAKAKRRVRRQPFMPAGAYPKQMVKTLVKNQGAQDPDLKPPAHPRSLSQHPAAKTLYEQGFGLFAQKENQAAGAKFNTLLRQHPNDVYSDNAQFWLGEVHYRQGNKDAAEAAWRKVLRHYAHRSTLEGYKTPDALYRLGVVHLERKEIPHARQFLRAAATRFPESMAARKARRTLAGISATAAR